jgi:hypothetical protein
VRLVVMYVRAVAAQCGHIALLKGAFCFWSCVQKATEERIVMLKGVATTTAWLFVLFLNTSQGNSSQPLVAIRAECNSNAAHASVGAEQSPISLWSSSPA